MPVLVKVIQNTNEKSKANGKFYGRVVNSGTMTYRALVKHMAEHNSIYGEDVCQGVAIKLQQCILEELMEGKKVQFGDLGTFHLTIKCKGAPQEDEFNMGQNIKGLYLRFTPNRQDVNDLSAKTLKKRAKFMNVKDLFEKKKKDDDETTEP